MAVHVCTVIPAFRRLNQENFKFKGQPKLYNKFEIALDFMAKPRLLSSKKISLEKYFLKENLSVGNGHQGSGAWCGCFLLKGLSLASTRGHTGREARTASC